MKDHIDHAHLYLHVPFCRQRCPYCDFYSTVGVEAFEEYLDAVSREFDQLTTRFSFSFVTVYVGGGTPSLLQPQVVVKLFETLRRKVFIEPTSEITIEANPEDVDLARIQAWKDVGVNRISLGVQSFIPRELVWLKRTHTVEQNLKALALLAKYFNNISIDLIVHLPGSTPDSIIQNVRYLTEFPITHVSVYGLTIEPKTALYAKWKRGEFVEMDEEEQRKQWLMVYEHLFLLGFEHYEISNWAKNKCYSRHNMAYWMGNPYIGLGPSAHSYVHPIRWMNVAHLKRYMQLLQEGEKWYEEEYITEEKAWIELLMLRLRTKWGLKKEEVVSKFGFDRYIHLVELIMQEELINFFDVDEEGIRLRVDGILLFDHLLEKIIAKNF